MTPHPYQVESIKHLTSVLNTEMRGVDASDMGIGKTLVAVEVEKIYDEPTLVVCPHPVMPGWLRTAKEQGAGFDVLNYEMLRTGRTPYGDWYLPKYCRKPRFRFNDGVRFVIFDEAHRCMSPTSKNSELMRAARRQNLHALALSATLADTPLELDALGFLLGLHDSNTPPTLANPNPVDFYSWARKYGCGKGMFSAFDFLGTKGQKKKEMAKIHRLLFPKKGVRVTIKELGNAFPKLQLTAELYELDKTRSIDSLYSEMREAISALHSRHEMLEGKRLEKARAYGFTGEKLSEDPLITLLRTRQEVELLKVPILVELTEDSIHGGFSVVLFVNFRATLEELCKRLDTTCFADGTQTGPSGMFERERNRLRFQNDESRVIVCNGETGGVGWDLHDVRGWFPRVAYNCAGYNAKLERQKIGRIRRAGAKSKAIFRFLFAAGTCEEKIHKKVSFKLDCLDALQDEDLMPDNLILDKTGSEV